MKFDQLPIEQVMQISNLTLNLIDETAKTLAVGGTPAAHTVPMTIIKACAMWIRENRIREGSPAGDAEILNEVSGFLLQMHEEDKAEYDEAVAKTAIPADDLSGSTH